jgi:hypothetical protein
LLQHFVQLQDIWYKFDNIKLHSIHINIKYCREVTKEQIADAKENAEIQEKFKGNKNKLELARSLFVADRSRKKAANSKLLIVIFN